MALGKKCGSVKSKRAEINVADEEVVLGFVRYYTRGLGRKRIAVLKTTEASPVDSNLKAPSKKRCSNKRKMINVDSGNENGNGNERSALEALPQDVLIRILCGVDHDDLEQLVHVSKTIREATSVAKQCHFAYSTPTKNRSSFRTAIDFDEDSSNFDDIEAPDAPKQSRPRPHRSRLSGKSLADISVALFASPDVQQWPRKDLFMDTEI